MGSFSWLKADELGKTVNVYWDMPFKFLIPDEFGGGYILDNYQDYGYLGVKDDGEPKYDMYELLAFWNGAKDLKYDGDEPPTMKEIDEYTRHNRHYGIEIGCYDHQIDESKYPLKLVSVELNKTYEEIDKPSYGDPDQGFGPTYRQER
jgi:hypothetical protein